MTVLYTNGLAVSSVQEAVGQEQRLAQELTAAGKGYVVEGLRQRRRAAPEKDLLGPSSRAAHR